MMQSGSGQLLSSAARTGGVPLMQLGLVQLVSVACTGGTPLTQLGLGQLVSAACTGGTPPRHLGLGQLSAACTGGMPLRHFGLVHSTVPAVIGGRPSLQCAEPVHVLTAAAGGGPPLQFGLPVHALAAVVDRPNEPAITAAKTTICPNSLRTCIVTIIYPSDLRPRTSPRASAATVTSSAEMGLKQR